MNADQIMPRLWVGGRVHSHLPRHHTFSMLVLCAREYQPSEEMVRKVAPGVKLVRAPLVDYKLTDESIEMVEEAGKEVANEVYFGGRVLVTCMMGINRSALVAGQAMRHLYPALTNEEIIQVIRAERKIPFGMALENEWFVEYIHGLSRRAA